VRDRLTTTKILQAILGKIYLFIVERTCMSPAAPIRVKLLYDGNSFGEICLNVSCPNIEMHPSTCNPLHFYAFLKKQNRNKQTKMPAGQDW
jgi:hypothetical protein